MVFFFNTAVVIPLNLQKTKMEPNLPTAPQAGVLCSLNHIKDTFAAAATDGVPEPKANSAQSKDKTQSFLQHFLPLPQSQEQQFQRSPFPSLPITSQQTRALITTSHATHCCPSVSALESDARALPFSECSNAPCLTHLFHTCRKVAGSSRLALWEISSF